jgi:FAD/FMN-containing dehydrogenase
MSDLTHVFPGSKVQPNDPRYPTLVRGFNQRWVGTPQFVQVCGDVRQVLETVQQASDENRRITVRGGGHCYENFVSGNHGGVIIDLSPLNSVYKEADGELFCVEGGCTLWNVYTQLYKEYGRTIPGGSCYSVGAGGHVCGGGYGLLSRLHGLVVDYLDAVELIHVTKEGQAELVKVSRDSADADERDLLWAQQGGGGGNFGIVTKYWFKDPPLAPAFASLASIAWDWDQMDQDSFTELVKNYGNFLRQHSQVDSPYKGLFALLHLTQEAASQIVLTIQNAGVDREVIADFINAVKLTKVKHGPQRFSVGYHHIVPHADKPRTMPWLEVTQTLDPVGPNQRGKYKSAYMIEPFPEPQIEVMWKYLTDSSYSNSQALVQVDSYGCQINAIAPDQTAVPQRSSIMKLQYQTYWTEPKDDAVNLNWIRNFYEDMYGARGPYPDGTVDGCYVNYPDVDLSDWQYLYYKDNYPKLQRVKQRWDGLNIFNHQQSIELPGSEE